MGSVCECCVCGVEYRGFPTAIVMICSWCDEELSYNNREEEAAEEASEPE